MHKNTPRRTALQRLTDRVRAGSVTRDTLRAARHGQTIVPLHRRVLLWHYGWVDGTPWTHDEIGAAIVQRWPYQLSPLPAAQVAILLEHSAARILTALRANPRPRKDHL
jgi:hypothetical protein